MIDSCRVISSDIANEYTPVRSLPVSFSAVMVVVIDAKEFRVRLPLVSVSEMVSTSVPGAVITKVYDPEAPETIRVVDNDDENDSVKLDRAGRWSRFRRRRIDWSPFEP